MILEIFDVKLCKIKEVDFESSAYTPDMIQRMSENGYSFKLNGVWIKRGDNVKSNDSNTESTDTSKTILPYMENDNKVDISKVNNLDNKNVLDTYNVSSGHIVDEIISQKPDIDEDEIADENETIDESYLNDVTSEMLDSSVEESFDNSELVKDSVQIEESEVKEPIPKKSSRKSRKIRCMETGIIYESQAQAARELGIDPTYVSDSLKTGKRRLGYSFERVEE